MNNKLVSIAMATYNGEKYLREQLDSIFNQSYNNIEVIVCDDCSTDNTLKILEEYSNQYGLIYFINEQNLGYVKNFERVISLCSGDFIALSDQDDIFLEDKIKILLEEINDNDVIHTDAILIDKNGDKIFNSYSNYSKKLVRPKSEIELVLNGCVTGCTCMMTKKFAKNIIPFPNNLYVHDKWIGFVAYKSDSLKYLDIPLIKYRQHSSNNIGATDVNSYSFLNKIKKVILKKTDNIELRTQILNQLNFTTIVLDKFNDDLKDKIKINMIKEYYNNLLNGTNLFKTLYIFIKLFKYFELNKPVKFRLGFFINFIRITILKKVTIK